MSRLARLTKLAEAYKVHIADTPVCQGHSAPSEFVESWVHDRPSLSLVHGPRGGGKSYLSAFATHVDSIRYDGHDTKILGGSEAQSQQIYSGLKDFRVCDALGGYEPIHTFNTAHATYTTGSEVSYIAASSRSVRGPHVPTLRLDEVDEMESEIREASIGMCMQLGGVPPSISMTSTWHKLSGPMSELVERGAAGEFPMFTFCAFEVLERCPEERSGTHLENCPACPLMKWCHSDIGNHPSRVPKAKRSNGHYTIDSLIQKTKAVGLRVFESDYLCLRPKAAAVWFTAFDETVHVTPKAAYDPRRPYHVSIDCGVHTGAVWFQIDKDHTGRPRSVNVFAEYFDIDSGPEANARALIKKSETLCGVGRQSARVSCDAASKQRTAGGRIVYGEYERAGLRGRNGLETWPMGTGYRKADGLLIIETLLRSAGGTVGITIHPDCKGLIRAFQSYKRKIVRNQLMDEPEDPQHPHEEYVDSLAGGLKTELPDGRAPEPQFKQVRAGQLI
jgi:hypothetical protein